MYPHARVSCLVYVPITAHMAFHAMFVAGLPDVHSELAKMRSVVLVAINTFGTQIMAWASCALLSTQLPPREPSGDNDRVHVFDHTFTVRFQSICI